MNFIERYIFCGIVLAFLSVGATSVGLSNQHDKVIVITGASQGIGLAMVEYLAAQGHYVCAGIRKTSGRQDIDTVAHKYPKNVMVVEIDVTDQQTIDLSIKHVVNVFGRIDVLINNACLVYMGLMETQSIAEQQQVMDVNYFGPVRMIQAVAPVMRKQKAGAIVNISSVAGIEPFPTVETYSASKAALESISESLATTLAPWNITVSLVEPGEVRTQAPANMRHGSRIIPETQCFALYEHRVALFFASRLAVQPNTPNVVEPLEVAQLVDHILAEKKPRLRYQVGDFAQQVAKNRFVDPCGDSYVRAKTELFNKQGLLSNAGV